MATKNEQSTVKPIDIALLVTGKDIPLQKMLLVKPDSDGKVDITNHGNSLFKAYNIRTGKPIVVYGDNGQSETWAINQTAGFIQLEEDGKFHLHVKGLENHPKQASPENRNNYGFPSILPKQFIKPEIDDQTSSSIENNKNIMSLSESMMQHISSAGLSEEGMKIVKNYIQDIEKQQPNLTLQQV